MKNHDDARRPGMVQLAQLVAPNSLLATVVLVAIALELFLVAFSQENIYGSFRTAVVGIAFVAWFWVTLGWSLYFLGCICRRTTREQSRFVTLLVWSLVTILSVGLILLYAISWFLFFHSGRFANYETWRFVAFNFDHLWTYVVEAEPIHLLTAGLLLAVALAAVPAALYWSSRAHWENHSRHLASKQFAVWLVLWLGLYGAWCNLAKEPSVHRRVTHSQALKHRMHPTMTLYASHLESRFRKPIEDTLDPASLVPLENGNEFQLTPAGPDAPSVIIVAIESLRRDTIHQQHQGIEVLPNINRLALKGLQLTRAYSQSTHSDYADVCLVSSLYPLRSQNHFYYGPNDPYPRTLIYDLLEPTGYSTAIISSQNEAWGGMVHFLERPSLQYFYHPETSDAETVYSELDTGFAHEVSKGGLVAGKLTDEHTTSEAINWIRKQVENGRPYFLSMNYQSSHFPYLIPDDCPRPFQPATLDPSISFVDYPEDQTETVRNAYFNSIHECDRQIGRLVEALKELGQLENTILIVTGENGEDFHECGTVTHAREPVQPAMHIACVFHAPKYLQPQVDDYPFEHVDLVPTILGLMGHPSHPNFQGIDVLSSNRPPADRRLTFCHVNSCFAQGDTIMLGGRWKLTQDHRTHETMLHDVENDPLQQTNLINDYPELASVLAESLNQWRNDQLAYYHFPHHYLSYYPPQPPAWPADQKTSFDRKVKSTADSKAAPTEIH